MKFTLKNSALLLIAILFSAQAAHAITLTDPATGFSVEAKDGTTLAASNGVYTLTYKKSYVRYMAARSPFGVKETSESFIKLANLKNVTKKNKNNSVQLSGKLGGKSINISFTANGNVIDIIQTPVAGKSNGKKKKKKGKARIAAAQLEAATAGEIAALLNALRTRQGGVSVPLQVQIPTRTFTAQDGTSAVVPDLPGWSFNGGGGGIISGSAAGQGVFEFGVPAVVSLPPLGGTIVHPFVDAGTAIVEVWPKYNTAYTGAQVQVTGGAVVDGTIGIFAPDFVSSAMFAISFNLNGEPWVGLMTSGTTPLPGAEAISYLWYHSLIAVPVNGPGGIGPALINTWATWNHSAADAQRLAQAAQTLASIKVTGAGPIDPDVFQAAANAWDRYIRGE